MLYVVSGYVQEQHREFQRDCPSSSWGPRDRRRRRIQLIVMDEVAVMPGDHEARMSEVAGNFSS